MRVKLSLCLCLLIGAALQLHAQTMMTGRVVDEQQQPVPYANIVLLSLPDSVFVQGMVTDNDGRFKFENVKSIKDKIVQISYIGYETVSCRCVGADIGTIALAADAYAG